MSILKLLFALNPKNLKLMKAEKMTPDMANQIDSFLGKIGAVVNIGKYKLTPKQAKFWVDQKKELDIYNKKLNEMIQSNKKTRTKKESVMVYDKDHKPGMAGMEVEIPASKKGIGSLDESKNVIDFPIKPKPPKGEPFAVGGRVEMASGGIAALKALLNFFAKQKSKKGSDMLREINPKKLGFLENMLMKSDKEMLDANRQEYLENLSDIIKSDKKLLDNIKKMPADQQESFFKKANEGGNQGRLSVYTDPNFNIDDAISEIEQMKKNLKFKDVPEKEIKRQMNANGGRVGFKKGGNYWLMVQEAYDAAGGEEQTGLSLFDFANKYFPKMADGGSVGMNVDGYKKGGSVKKSLSEKIINLLGGKDAAAAELGLMGMEQLYNLLGLPFYANGGAVGMPPISTSDPKQAGKIIIDSFLGSSVENIPLYQGNGLGITAGVGVGNQRPFDYGVGFNYGNFQGGVQMNQGNPSFGIGYRKEFSNGGGVKSGPPPERGPNPQGLETLFQKR